jgi:hypothetical protein
MKSKIKFKEQNGSQNWISPMHTTTFESPMAKNGKPHSEQNSDISNT